jgi:hypothetical protein
VEDPTTIALNLTFFGTLGVAFVMFLGLVAVFVATLVMAGIGRLAAITIMAIGGGVARAVGAATAAIRPTKSPAPAKAGRTEASQLSADWTAAVERADTRAAARAKAEAAPALKVSARDLPGPTVPAQEIPEGTPLVESATDRDSGLSTVPRASKEPAAPAARKPMEPASKKPKGSAPKSRLDGGPVPGPLAPKTSPRSASARNRKAG